MISPRIVRVFPLSESGGNPAPIVLDAGGMSERDMLEVARTHGLESGFVFPPVTPNHAHFRFRFFVPRHEMEMCGHATIGALWLLRDAGRLPEESVWIETQSGLVQGFAPAGDGPIRITQPVGTVETVDGEGADRILDVLRLRNGDLVGPVLNAGTSRIKTLVPLGSPNLLNSLAPDFPRIESVCNAVSSTGLYPFAADRRESGLFHARQFPKASGYPEDAATGIAASALAFGLLHIGKVGRLHPDIRVQQGEAMGRPSEIGVHLMFSERTGMPSGCLIGGICRVAPA